MVFGSWDSLVLIGLLLALAYHYFWNKNQYFARLNITHAKPWLIVGNAWKVYTVQQHNMDFYNNIYNQFPKERYVGLFNFTKPEILLRDPEVLKQVFVKDFDHFTDHTIVVDEAEMMSKILLFMRGNAWKELRSTLTPTFTASKMRSMITFMQECADNLVTFLDDEIVQSHNGDLNYIEKDMTDLFSRYANDVIASCAFGIKINSFEDQNNSFYAHAMELSNFKLSHIFILSLYLIFPSLKKASTYFNIKFGQKATLEFFRDTFMTNLKNRETHNIGREDMIHLLLLARKGQLNESGQNESEKKKDQKTSLLNWDDDFILAQAVTFLFAGFETISKTLSFLSYELATNPDVQKKLQQEIDNHLDQCKGVIDFDGTKQLKYFDMVISESLRMHSIFPCLDRLCVKPFELPPQNDGEKSGLKVKVGDHLIIPLHSFHQDPKYFTNPHKFDPERFSSENKGSITPFTYMPFGFGPRTCIAMRFAILELKIAIFTLISKYEFVRCEKTPPQMKIKPHMFLMNPEMDNWVGLKRRTQKK